MRASDSARKNPGARHGAAGANTPMVWWTDAPYTAEYNAPQ